jgi:tetratricopeptide (TPR) repeat protein
VADKQVGDLSRASVMIDLGRYGDAASLLASVVASSPDSSRAWCLLSRAHLGDGNAVEAVAAAARARALGPADDWPYRLTSTALIALGQTGEAVTAAQEACRRAPHFWRAHLCLAQAATAAGQHEMAAEAAIAALALAPEQPDVHVTAGKAALARGEFGAARRWQESALAIDPAHSDAINELGRISLSAGDAPTAAGHFLRAARMSPRIGVFSRNTELALGRVAHRITAFAWLAVLIAPFTVFAAMSGSLPLTVAYGLPALALTFFAIRAVRRLPSEVRGPMFRLVWNQWAQAGHRVRTALVDATAARRRGRVTSANLQAGNGARPRLTSSGAWRPADRQR